MSAASFAIAPQAIEQFHEGQLLAQKAAHVIATRESSVDLAWTQLRKLATAHGWESDATRAFVVTLARAVR